MSTTSKRWSGLALVFLFGAFASFAILAPARPSPRPPEPKGFGGYLPVNTSSGSGGSR